MDAISTARQLGKAIQEDQRYKTLQAATTMNDSCEPLQENIARFSELRDRINEEISKSEKDAAKVSEMDAELQKLYEEIMNTPEMLAYSMAKSEMESFLGFINQIISGSANGQDPDAIEMEESCSGSCSSCSGCH
jgi:cell fate (sporulation/competence/biofilm development) regulator YlbF (YheA/YmcA/DUF963 family)